MDKIEELRRWHAAQESHRAAQHALLHGFLATSASRSYYACFQAMWVALGNPPRGEWKHGGLIQHFCLGRWTNPVTLPSSLAGLCKKLLHLYHLRLDADYRALPIAGTKAREGLNTVAEVFQLVTQSKTF